MKIAFIGGSPGHYDEVKLTDFLQKVRQKYPDATIHTGSDRGGEAQVREWAELVGMTLVVPPLYEDHFGPEAKLMQVISIIQDVEVIVIIGTPTGGRASLATQWWHRMNMHKRDVRGKLIKEKGQFVSQRESGHIKLHNVAVKKKEKK